MVLRRPKTPVQGFLNSKWVNLINLLDSSNLPPSLIENVTGFLGECLFSFFDIRYKRGYLGDFSLLF